MFKWGRSLTTPLCLRRHCSKSNWQGPLNLPLGKPSGKHPQTTPLCLRQHCSKSNWNLDANSQWPTQSSLWEAFRKASANGVSQEPKVLKNHIVGYVHPGACSGGLLDGWPLPGHLQWWPAGQLATLQVKLALCELAR